MTFQQTVSAEDTVLTASLAGEQRLPRGSACITSSGKLAQQGISAIIHAATGSADPSLGGIHEPTLDSVQHSIENGFRLLIANVLKKMAVPFIGGDIFLGRIGVTAPVLADRIVSACLTHYGAYTVIVTWNDADHTMFQNIVKSKWPAYDPDQLVMKGDITSFAVHGAPAIMNAANMEVQFGGGLSGSIAMAAGGSAAIDAEALQDIQQFWAAHGGSPGNPKPVNGKELEIDLEQLPVVAGKPSGSNGAAVAVAPQLAAAPSSSPFGSLLSI